MNNVFRSAVLLTALVGIGGALAAWKFGADPAAGAGAAQAEPAEAVSAATAVAREHRGATSAIGTVLALRSVTLRNEIAGTVRQVNLQPGAIVDAGSVLVALDVSVEQADLKAQQAQLGLANATLKRLEALRGFDAISEIDLDKARAERDVAAAQVARTEAVIARKLIRVPFRARVGLANLHPGQYLQEGTEITTLQSVDEALHVDFAVPQAVAAALKPGDRVDVFAAAEAGRAAAPIAARIAAVDAKVDPATRNSTVRARIQLGKEAAASAVLPVPGSSMRVSVAVGQPAAAVAIPATALRKGPAGDHVFVLAAGADKQLRAHQRPVQVGAALGDEVLVTGGLAAGEQVAASGSFKLRDTALVAVAPAPTRTSAKAGAATGG
ncbi:efflux RND transporter periplasmic adaptor subunit [Ideonella sp. BN130291]|uniref:efflux RND transporter periplasmic adaptor subunit n=1 Tax=Ideonella sp. BN130291 TaxID=3112940 RepID=UPI002E26448F|nr:efflux RND transporter periplasmic adaptor subunit [Ideonella sp. BN130291]